MSELGSGRQGREAIGVMRMLWTDEAIEDLKRLALEGRSASAIAAALGAASRNAVIGKANRIGIRLNGGGRAAASKATPVGAPAWRRPPAIPTPKPASKKWKAAWTGAEVQLQEMRRVR